mmetsp:Transcript_7392/g.24371  ORF Transcript_7392/g.24371 Transcript_7392/m.24371 type:complete len:245 (-) Transcript_7392:1114-1848(-)
MSGLPSRRASRGAELRIGSPVANARARDKVTPDKALRTDEAWAAKEELIRYYEVARASPSTTRPKLPKAVRDDKHTIFSIPGERGMIATLVDIFTDHNIAQLVLFLVDRPDFVDAVESAFLDGLHACGAADAVLERAAGLARSVLRTDTAGLVELLKAPGSCTESTRLAWYASPRARLPTPRPRPCAGGGHLLCRTASFCESISPVPPEITLPRITQTPKVVRLRGLDRRLAAAVGAPPRSLRE